MADITVDQLTTQTFYQIPQIFFSRIKHEGGKKSYIKYTSSYVSLSSDAKLAYGALYNRCLLSIKSYHDGDRTYIDENGAVFLIFTVKDLMLFLDKAKGTVIKIKKELQAHGLLREVRLGVNKANRLYLQLVNADLEVREVYDENDTLIKKLDTAGKVIYQNPDFSKKEGASLDNSGSSIFGLPKIEPQEVQKLDPNNTEYSDTDNLDSSRKSGTDTATQNQPGKYIPTEYYSLLQVIADRYNERYMYPEGYTLTHHQKMQIGQYLSSGYTTSNEVLDMIDRIPSDCERPLAYLLKMLDNLREERRLEEKMVAHKNAQRYYQGQK